MKFAQHLPGLRRRNVDWTQSTGKDTQVNNPKEEMIRSTYPRLISDLTEEERKSVEASITVLPKVFHECESYLRELRSK
jgi:hypothetical protein